MMKFFNYKNSFFAALTISSIFLIQSPVFAHTRKTASAKKSGLSAVCSRIVGLGGVKYKAIPSDHITTGPRTNGISLIFKRGASLPSSSCLTIYASNGSAISRFGLYERNGAIFGARYYSGAGCAPSTNARSVAAAAKRAGGNNSIYINTGGTSCLKVNDALHDQGSVS
jgi:hypothetical protein